MRDRNRKADAEKIRKEAEAATAAVNASSRYKLRLPPWVMVIQMVLATPFPYQSNVEPINLCVTSTWKIFRDDDLLSSFRSKPGSRSASTERRRAPPGGSKGGLTRQQSRERFSRDKPDVVSVSSTFTSILCGVGYFQWFFFRFWAPNSDRFLV